MKLALYQSYPEWGKVEQNLLKIEKKLVAHPEVDLWILPELCITGYKFKSKKELLPYAEEFPSGVTARKILQLTSELQNAVIMGVAEKVGGKVYNSAAVFEKGKFVGLYRKIHLFDKEKYVFTAGNKRPEVFEIMDTKVGVMICFDWIYPEVARSLALQGAELIAHCTNLVLPFCQKAMATRSIENRIYTATSNRIGVENHIGEELRFTGQSQVVDVNGKILSQASENSEDVIITDIDPVKSRDKKITPLNSLFDDRKVNLYYMGENDG